MNNSMYIKIFKKNKLVINGTTVANKQWKSTIQTGTMPLMDNRLQASALLTIKEV